MEYDNLDESSRISRSPLVKLVPLSERSSWTWSLLAMNRLSAGRNESVSRQWAISICTVRTFMHVKMTPYLLTRLLARCTWNGLKQSPPTVVNGVLSGTKWYSGKSAIFCSQNGASCLRQLQHFVWTLLTAEFAFMTKYFWRNWLDRCCLSEWRRECGNDRW